MLEYKILQALGESKEAYDSVRKHITPLLSQQGLKVLKHIDDYYIHDDDARRVDWDVLREIVLSEYDSVPKHRKSFEDYFITLTTDTADASPENVGVLVRKGLIQKTSLELIDNLTLDPTSQASSHKLVELQELVASEQLDDEVDEEYTSMNVRDLLSTFDEGSRIRPGPAALTEKLGGGLRKGHHLILFARPEVGKSMFAISMACNCLRQGYRVLYVGNEDPIPDLIMRVVNNLSLMPEDAVMADPDAAMEKAKAAGYDNITFIGMSPGTIEAIDAACAKYNPDVLVIDQLRNVAAKTENNTLRLDTVARGARNIGRRRNCVVISVTQAGDSAENHAVLGMGDVDGSNTGIPGACDVMVGVGNTEATDRLNTRVLSLPKNKVGRNHEHFTVGVSPVYSMVRTWEDVPMPKVTEDYNDS